MFELSFTGSNGQNAQDAFTEAVRAAQTQHVLASGRVQLSGGTASPNVGFALDRATMVALLSYDDSFSGSDNHGFLSSILNPLVNDVHTLTINSTNSSDASYVDWVVLNKTV